MKVVSQRLTHTTFTVRKSKRSGCFLLQFISKRTTGNLNSENSSCRESSKSSFQKSFLVQNPGSESLEVMTMLSGALIQGSVVSYGLKNYFCVDTYSAYSANTIRSLPRFIILGARRLQPRISVRASSFLRGHNTRGALHRQSVTTSQWRSHLRYDKFRILNCQYLPAQAITNCR